MEDERLTSELLRMEKSNTKRWFVAFLIVLSMLFLETMAWLYYWNLPSEETTTQVEQENDNGYNNYIGNDGDINNGKADDNNKNNEKKQATKEQKTKEQKAAR